MRRLSDRPQEGLQRLGIDRIGSAHDDARLELLQHVARQRQVDGRDVLLLSDPHDPIGYPGRGMAVAPPRVCTNLTQLGSEASPGDGLLTAVGGAADQDCCGRTEAPCRKAASSEPARAPSGKSTVRTSCTEVHREDETSHRPGRGLDGEVGSATRPASPRRSNSKCVQAIILEHADMAERTPSPADKSRPR